MYDINTKKIKRKNHFYLMFLIVGFIFLLIIGGMVVFNYKKLVGLNSSTMSRGVRIKSSINDDGNTMYSSIYYYRVDGIDYSCSPNSLLKTNPGTENKKIYYNSKKPSKCMPNPFNLNIWTYSFLLLIPIFIITFSIRNIKKITQKIKKIEELNTKGKLVKNLSFQLKIGKKYAVNYTLSSGDTVTLYSNSSYDKKKNGNKTVDLVIDESNPRNYYIDFEINRLSGNLPQDYFKQSSQKSKSIENHLDEKIEYLTEDDIEVTI